MASHEYPRVAQTDPPVADALAGELERQRSTFAMIASENHVSPAVLEAQGSALTNKYAEGYPGERYYGGCQQADEVEQLAIERAKEIWGADHINVQPHAGTQANMAVYMSILDPGDKILSLDLTHGGHLSHGHPANFAGQLYEVEQYEVDEETGYVDYEGLREHAEEFEPDIIVSGYSAYPREVDFGRIQAAADAADAYHLADIAHITGLVAAGVHESPVGVADFVTGSTHKTIRAGRGGIIMCDEEYTDDITTSPAKPSGSKKPSILPSMSTPNRQSTTPSHSATSSWSMAWIWSPAAPTTTSSSSTSVHPIPTRPVRMSRLPSKTQALSSMRTRCLEKLARRSILRASVPERRD